MTSVKAITCERIDDGASNNLGKGRKIRRIDW